MATLQLLTAVTFLISTIFVFTSGAAAQAAAEAEVAREGLPASYLADNSIRFDDPGAAARALPIAIVVVLVALAVLNLAGKRIGRILSFVFQPILAVAGALVIYGQVFPEQIIKDDRMNVHAVVEASRSAYPAALPYVVIAKFVLAVLGSLVIVVLLAVHTRGVRQLAESQAER